MKLRNCEVVIVKNHNYIAQRNLTVATQIVFGNFVEWTIPNGSNYFTTLPLIFNHLNCNPSKLIFLEYLVNNKIDRNEEREQVCSLLLKSGRFQEINSTRLQQLVAKANFHSIYFDLAIQNKDYKERLIEF